MVQLHRRQFLAGAAAMTLAPSANPAEPQDETVAYFLVGDTHYLAKNDAQLDDRSALVTRRGKLVGVFTVTDACRLLAAWLRARFPLPQDPDVA